MVDASEVALNMQAKTCKALSTLALGYLYAEENKILYFKNLSLMKGHQ
jgi:hypothetical protein